MRVHLEYCGNSGTKSDQRPPDRSLLHFLAGQVSRQRSPGVTVLLLLAK